MRIATKIALGAALPCLALLGFAADRVHGTYGVRSEAQTVLVISNLGAPIGALVHELQKERGQSVTFVTSRGKTFADTLTAQRTASDGAQAAL